MAQTDAQKRANNKYREKNLKSFTVNARIQDYELISSYADSIGMSKAKLLINSTKYVVKNNIDVRDDTEKE